MKTNVITFDPSINSCGFAGFTAEGKVYSSTIQTESISLEGKLSELGRKVSFLLGKYTPEHCFIELPGSQGTRSIVALSSEAFTKLCLATGVIAGAVFARSCMLLHFVPVYEWKGQLPKHVTGKRVAKQFGYTPQTDDEADALGILAWQMDMQQ